MNGRGSRHPQWLPFVLFAVLWVDLIRQLSYTWESREQYAYGWFVPFFALYFFWRRWLDRPVPAPRTPPLWQWASILLIAVLLLPLRVVLEINVDWPLICWFYATNVVLLSLYAIYRAGGWPWARHFLFPVAFILISVTWPHRIEKGLTQQLMQVVASITVELLGFLGIPALQRGNMIEVSTGVVGVDEACSGIRSFQSTLMASLLMGELYRFRLTPRFALLGFGLGTAFVFNIIRTLFLSWQASKHGVSSIDKWHDSAGLTVLGACFFGLWWFAGFIRSRWPALSPGIRASTHKAQTGTSRSDFRNQPPAPVPALSPSSQLPAPHSRGAAAFLLATGCWAVCIVAFTQGWYRFHEVDASSIFRWTALAPEDKPGFQTIELPPKTAKLLMHDFGITTRWQESDGSDWSMYFFRWNPTSATAIFHARQHRPDVCLPASGLRLIEDLGVARMSVGEFMLPFRRYVYESDGRAIFVFFCQWEDGSREQSGLAGSEQSGRVITALQGRRHFGQQSLEFILSGYPSMESASAALRKNLPQLVQVDNPSSPSRQRGSN